MHIDIAGLAIALILLALAGLVWWDMTKLQLLSPYDVGPKAMPVIVSAGLALLAIGNGILTVENDDQAWVRARRSDKDKGGFAARAALTMIALKQKLGA